MYKIYIGITIIVLLGLSVSHLIAENAIAMEKCQENYSFDTCHHTMYN